MAMEESRAAIRMGIEVSGIGPELSAEIVAGLAETGIEPEDEAALTIARMTHMSDRIALVAREMKHRLSIPMHVELELDRLRWWNDEKWMWLEQAFYQDGHRGTSRGA